MTRSAAPRPAAAARPAAAPRAQPGLRVAPFVRGLPDHPWLDRLVRGRVWIPLLGVMLAGIVAMQVEVLKLGASIGRSMERGSVLQSRNEQLRESVASLADDQRIERLAATMGMVMPAPTGVGFLSEHVGANVQQAIANIHPPNAPGFLSSLQASAAVTTTSAIAAPGTAGPAASTLAATAGPGAASGPSTPAASSSPAPQPTSATPPAASAGQPTLGGGAAAPAQSAPTRSAAPASSTTPPGASTTGGAALP